MTDCGNPPRRSRESWEPFMEGLFGEIKRIRRRRRIRRAGAAAFLAAALGSLVQVTLVETDELLRADIPTAEAPVFQPDFPGGDGPLFYVVTVEGEQV